MNFAPQSKVWVYHADSILTEQENQLVTHKLAHFISKWESHGQLVKAKAEIRHNRFIIITADETIASIGGCAIDALIRIMKEIGKEMKIDFFNRFYVSYRNPLGTIVSANRNEFEHAIATGEISANTIVFNSLVENLEELNTQWEIPFKQSWHRHVFPMPLPI